MCLQVTFMQEGLIQYDFWLEPVNRQMFEKERHLFCFCFCYLLLFLARSLLANERWKVVMVVGITDKIIQTFWLFIPEQRKEWGCFLARGINWGNAAARRLWMQRIWMRSWVSETLVVIALRFAQERKGMKEGCALHACVLSVAFQEMQTPLAESAHGIWMWPIS